MIDYASVLTESVASTANSWTFFVNKRVLFGFIHYGFSVSVILEISPDLMRIEIMLFDAERRRHFSFFIKLSKFEHYFSVKIVDYVTGALFH